MTAVTITVSAKVTRNYGAEILELGAEMTLTLEGKEARHNAYARLLEGLYNEHERYTAEFLPKVPNAKEEVFLKRPDDGEWIACESIELEIKERKRYYAVKGGKYTTHGVRVWNEVLRAAGWLEFMAEHDHLDIPDYEMLVVSGESGRKVAQFRKVGSE